MRLKGPQDYDPLDRSSDMDPRRSKTAARLVFFGPDANDGRNNNRALHSPASLVVADRGGVSNCGVCAMSVTRRSFLMGVAAAAIAPALPATKTKMPYWQDFIDPAALENYNGFGYTWEFATPEQIMADVRSLVQHMRHLSYEPQYLWASKSAHEHIFGKNNGFSEHQPPGLADRYCRCVPLLSVAEAAQ